MALRRSAKKMGDTDVTEIVIDGDDFDDHRSFYSCIGRHFTPSFDGDSHFPELVFQDALWGGHGLEPPFRIVWKNADRSREILDSAKLQSSFLVSIQRNEFLDDDGKALLERSLELAKTQSEWTLFQYLAASLLELEPIVEVHLRRGTGETKRAEQDVADQRTARRE